uniref:Acyl-CoA dehydrogenase/oxidase C-terminal domain-containing protein n=1 Tax=Gossypium raimondii TaxID=29730 RepID=A0A0D2T042_GOSRA|nr:hypothetical protein B456_006G183300 [Gossypium raimondii]
MTVHSQIQDETGRSVKPSYFSSPPLDVSVAFPQATPASTFPPLASDYYQFNDLLSPEEQALRKKVRECMEKEVAPIMAEYWEKAEFPFQIVPKLGALHISGGTIKGYGCPGLSLTGSAIAMAEVARVDASCSTFILVHSSLAMLTIATKIPNKIGLRIVQNGDILLKEVFVLDEDRLPGVNSFQDTSKVLAVSRVMVAWQPIGISMGVYDMCARYLKERKQFGAPLAAFQINQQKLARMLGNIQAMTLVGWRLCKLYEEGKMTPGHASLGKSWITSMARETAALGRELLGGNGILADFLVAKAFCDLEPIYTYEGTYDINSLVTGREITGFASFKPALVSQRSRL